MKYYTAVLAVFRDEASFMSAWLNHYFTRGVEHIYLLNDRSADNFYTPEFERYLADGKITLRNVLPEDFDNKQKDRQSRLYNKYFGDVVLETFWVGIFDLDEFYYSPATKNLSDLLRNYEGTSYQEILADWYWFGSAGFENQPDDIVGSFLYRAEHVSRVYNYEPEGYHHEWCCKAFSKTRSITKLQHHFNYHNYRGSTNFCSEGKRGYEEFSFNLSRDGVGFVNHYVGAGGYYTTKKLRGSCNNSNINRDETLYNKINKNDVFDPRLAEQTYGRTFTNSRDAEHVVPL